MSIQSTSLPLLSCDPARANMQLSHGTLVHDGRSLDGQEYQRGDSVALVDNGPNEDLTDSVHVLNLRSRQYMLVFLKAVCWIPTHTEQRSGATFLLTLYGPDLDFRQPGATHPHMGNRGITTLLGSSVYVAREVIMGGNPSRIALDSTDRVSMFTVQWDTLSLDTQIQPPALTPSTSCASSRSPSESGDDVPVMHFYRHQGRRDSAIEIRDPESPIYKSSRGYKTSPKPLLNRSAFFATKQDTRISTELPTPRQHCATWSDLGSDDEPGFELGTGLNFDAGCSGGLDLDDLDFAGMNPNSDLQVNFVFMPQAEGENYVPGHQEQQRPETNTQSPMWATPDNSWNPVQMPPQQEMRQPQMPTSQRQHHLPQRQEAQPDYYDQYRMMEDHSRSHAQSGAFGHHSEQLEAPHMQAGQRPEFIPPQQLPQASTSHPVQAFQMQPRYAEQSARLPAPNATTSPFPMPQEVHIIQSSRHEARPPYPLPSSSYSPVHENSLPSASHSQQPRRSPRPDDSRSSSARGTPVMARRAKPQPVHTFTPTALLTSFRQSTQAHIETMERHLEQLQQGAGTDEQLRTAQETLQAFRRTTEDSLQALGMLQPISGIPFQGTERRLQSLADQIATSMQNLLPEAPGQPEDGIKQLEQKLQSLKEFLEYLEGVHPEAVKRAQGSAESSSAAGNKTQQESRNATVSTTGRVPSAPASVSSQVAASDDSDSCRWVDGQATPPPDRSGAMAQNRDHSRLFRDVANGHARIRPEARVATSSGFYPVTSYSQPSSHMNSPITSHPAPAEAGHGFFQQQPLPAPVQQNISLSDYAMQSRPIHAYTPPTSAEMMRPMQPVSSLPTQHYTTQQENPFCLRPAQQNCMYPTSGAEISPAGYAPRSPIPFHPATGAPPQSGYYQDARPGFPDRRTMRQERPAPYSLNYRDQRRRRGSQ